MADFTPLDSLKECAVRGNLALTNAIGILNTPGALALPDAIDRLTCELALLQQVLEESIVAHVDLDAPDAERFGDGRPVVTLTPLDNAEVVHHQPWSANPSSPRDQPQIVLNTRTSSGTRWRVAILRPGEVDAVRLADPEPDETRAVRGEGLAH